VPIPAGSILPTLADLKAHLNITSTTHDVELQTMLEAAAEVVVGYVGPLDGTQVTETHYEVRRGLPLVLRRYPVLSVASVTDSHGKTYAASEHTTDGASGLLRLNNGTWAGDITVTYTAGRAVLPAAVGLAVLVITAHLWETQRGNTPSALPTNPDEATFDPGRGFAVPNRALELLRPYLTGVTVA
jgi:hypothetical protein